MRRGCLWLASVLLILFGLGTDLAEAASSINTTQPANGVPYSPAPIRQNFQAAAADINALQSCNAGSNPPSNPPVGTCWLQTSLGAIYTVWKWDGRSWDQIGAIDTTNHIWMPPVGGGVLPNIISGNLTDLGSFPQAALNVTGSNQIANLGSSAPAGAIKVMVFAGTPTLLNSSSLQIPGGVNVAQQVGDVAIALNLGASNWKIVYDSQVGPTLPSVRTALTGNLNMYINPAIGNDTNTCILPGAPCQTIQQAINTLQSNYDLRGFTATINLAPGTYTAGALVAGLLTGQQSASSFIILGNPSNPDSVVISDTRSNPSNQFSGFGTPILALNGGALTINGVKLVAGFRSIWAEQGSSIVVGNVDYGTAGECQNVSAEGSEIRFSSNYTISAGGAAHYCAFNAGVIYAPDANNPTLSISVSVLNNPSYSLAFAASQITGAIQVSSNMISFVGTTVGSRYFVSLNGVISTVGSNGITGGVNFFPGTLPGIIMSGGQYDNLIAQRIIMTANTSFYVSPGGNDTNNSCLALATPCATPQRALDVIQMGYDLHGFIATINLGNGSYTASGSVAAVNGPFVGARSLLNAAGPVILQGNVATPDSVVLTTTGTNTSAVLATGGGLLTVTGMKLVASNTNGKEIYATLGGSVNFSLVDFGQAGLAQIQADTGGSVQAIGNYTISAGATVHAYGAGAGIIGLSDPVPGGPVFSVTLTGTPAFSTAFALSQDLGLIIASSSAISFSGSATGNKCTISGNSVVDTGGGGIGFLPGSVNCSGGLITSGGQYL